MCSYRAEVCVFECSEQDVLILQLFSKLSSGWMALLNMDSWRRVGAWNMSMITPTGHTHSHIMTTATHKHHHQRIESNDKHCTRSGLDGATATTRINAVLMCITVSYWTSALNMAHNFMTFKEDHLCFFPMLICLKCVMLPFEKAL